MFRTWVFELGRNRLETRFLGTACTASGPYLGRNRAVSGAVGCLLWAGAGAVHPLPRFLVGDLVYLGSRLFYLLSYSK